MIDPTGIEPVDRQRRRTAFMAALSGGLVCAQHFAKAQPFYVDKYSEARSPATCASSRRPRSSS